MSEEGHWNAGDTIIFRGINQRKIWYAIPMFVFQDKPNLVALYWPAGTQGKWRLPGSGARVSPKDVLFTPMELIDHTWNKTDVLMLITPGTAHAIYLMWEEGWKKLLCWYVNLQDPICRTAIGFDTKDHLMDIIFNPDKSSWQWKDEDELEEAVSLGIFTNTEALAIRKEGERVINLIHENQPPFCDSWEKWSPPPHWGVPELCTEWKMGFC
jgi:hypothetical protein